ncbi:MAG: RsmE family RNA methyltransferase [Acidimicrobiales bacterium]
MNGGVTIPPRLRDASALVYVDDLESPEVRAEDSRHLWTVLRLQKGETVVVCDGQGRYRGCTVATASTGGGADEPAATALSGRSSRRRGREGALVLLPATEVLEKRRAVPALTVGFSLAKGDRNDWAVAKLSELGVDRIVPLMCERTTVRLNQQQALHQHERLRRIAREASMQARRIWLPEVLDVVALADAPSRLCGDERSGGGIGNGIALAEPGGPGLSLATPTVLVGPEGGFTPAELAMGLRVVGLGDTVLRIETAAIAAGTILSALRAGLLSPAAAVDDSRPHRPQ